MQQWVSIDSTSIGGGKSTLLNCFAKKYNLKIHNAKIIEEPVHLFRKYCQYNPLELTYTSPQGNMPLCQLHFIRCLKKVYCDARETRPSIIITERSLYSPIIFTTFLHGQGFLTEFSKDFLINEALNVISENNFPFLGSDKLFFLNTPVNTCIERVKLRGRVEEQTSTFELGSHLHALRETYIEFTKHFTHVKGNNNLFVSNSTDLDTLCEELYKFCFAGN